MPEITIIIMQDSIYKLQLVTSLFHTNSYSQCCIRLLLTVLGNSCHYSSIHRKLGISDICEIGINFQLQKQY